MPKRKSLSKWQGQSSCKLPSTTATIYIVNENAPVALTPCLGASLLQGIRRYTMCLLLHPLSRRKGAVPQDNHLPQWSKREKPLLDLASVKRPKERLPRREKGDLPPHPPPGSNPAIIGRNMGVLPRILPATRISLEIPA